MALINLILCAFRVIYSTTKRKEIHQTEVHRMNEKIAHQIEKMKKQTIGVEVEMNNIKRDRSFQIQQEQLREEAERKKKKTTMIVTSVVVIIVILLVIFIKCTF